MVTQSAGAPSAIRYVHVDHLGSVDVITDSGGNNPDRRSYDAFGARRDPSWGAPPPASFPPSQAALGFTGHIDDDELGLVHMRGRMYDPRLGRFLTPDPIVAAPQFGQSWNAYSYVLNNPLAYLDPSGFAPEDPVEERLPPGVYEFSNADGSPRELLVVGPPPKRDDPRASAAEAGDVVTPVDVGIIGNAAGFIPEPTLSDSEQRGLHIVGDIGLGVVDAVGDIGVNVAKTAVLNALTFGGYGTYEIGKAMWAGYNEDGVLGALNAVNPFYQVAKAGVDTAIAAERGDYRAAGARGTTTAVLMIATVLGAGDGAEALTAKTAAVPAGAGGVARGPAATRDLAQKIANAERFPMNLRRTVTVLETKEGPTLVAGGASDLSRAQVALARELGLTPASPIPGVHAEPTAISGAGELGLRRLAALPLTSSVRGPAVVEASSKAWEVASRGILPMSSNMNDNEIISAVRTRVQDPMTRTDYASKRNSHLASPATSKAISDAERQLGFSLLSLHRRLFQEVANGGFGPGDGLIGLEGGAFDAHGRSVVELRNNLWLDSETPLPTPVVPLCDWGDGIWSCIDAETGMILTLDENGLTDTGQSFQSWLVDWVSGVNLFEKMFIFEERTAMNPFTRQPVAVRVPARPSGTPYVSRLRKPGSAPN